MFPAVTIAAEISRAVCQSDIEYRPPTSVTICYEHRTNLPLEVFAPIPESHNDANSALDWLALGKEVLPNTRPLSAEERSSVNEFFLSHFQ
jgi:hypothetical protein